MDCDTARQWLEARRDDSDPQHALPPEVAEHLHACAPCRNAQHAIATLDHAIARRMRNIPVPDALKTRLLDRLASAQLPSDASPATVPPSAPDAHAIESLNSSRRKWFSRTSRRTHWIAAAGSLAAAAALLVVWLLGRDARWTAADVQQLVTDAAFDKLGEPVPRPHALPRALLRAACFAAGEKVLEGRRITVLHYRVPRTTVECEVYVFPKEILSEPVPGFSRMLRTTGAGMTLAIWREGDHVFAFISRGAGGEDVLQQLRPSHELT